MKVSIVIVLFIVLSLAHSFIEEKSEDASLTAVFLNYLKAERNNANAAIAAFEKGFKSGDNQCCDCPTGGCMCCDTTLAGRCCDP